METRKVTLLGILRMEKYRLQSNNSYKFNKDTKLLLFTRKWWNPTEIKDKPF
jgi:hypothetical protein